MREYDFNEKKKNIDDIIDIKRSDTQNQNQIVDKTIVRVLFNKVYVVNIDKHKLLKKSLYFRKKADLKKLFKDYKSEIIELKFKTSRKIFKQVMQFITNGKLNLHKNTIFKIYHLAVYLQVTDLNQLCLDYFTFNLNLKNLGNQINSLPDCQFLGNDLKERVLKFYESGAPAFKGLYFLEVDDNNIPHLKIISQETSSLRHIKINIPKQSKRCKYNFELENFCNTLVLSNSIQHSKFEHSLLVYNIVSGETAKLTTEACNHTVICCRNRKLFTVSVVEKEKEYSSLCFSTYEKVSGRIELCTNTTVEQPFKIKSPFLKDVYLFFAHCVSDKLYVFYCECKYKRKKYWMDKKYNLSDIYMMTFCLQTKSVVKNEKIKLDKNVDLKRFCKEFITFKKLLYVDKEQKLFIQIDQFTMLVFDIKNKSFYLMINEIFDSVHKHFSSYSYDFKLVTKGSKIFVVFVKYYDIFSIHNNDNYYDVSTEIATFRYEDDTIKDGKTIRECSDRQIPYGELLPCVHAACFV